jgi:hypothetical protein
VETIAAAGEGVLGKWKAVGLLNRRRSRHTYFFIVAILEAAQQLEEEELDVLQVHVAVATIHVGLQILVLSQPHQRTGTWVSGAGFGGQRGRGWNDTRYSKTMVKVSLV